MVKYTLNGKEYETKAIFMTYEQVVVAAGQPAGNTPLVNCGLGNTSRVLHEGEKIVLAPGTVIVVSPA